MKDIPSRIDKEHAIYMEATSIVFAVSNWPRIDEWLIHKGTNRNDKQNRLWSSPCGPKIKTKQRKTKMARKESDGPKTCYGIGEWQAKKMLWHSFWEGNQIDSCGAWCPQEGLARKFLIDPYPNQVYTLQNNEGSQYSWKRGSTICYLKTLLLWQVLTGARLSNCITFCT